MYIMKHSELVDSIIEQIELRYRSRVFMVAIDGVDAAGKTTFAAILSEELRNRKHNVIEASKDGFHNPRKVRYRMGRESPEGYYRDSFNINALKAALLDPLRKGEPYRTSVFDYRIDSETNEAPVTAPEDVILVFEGVFSLRPELLGYWDYRVYLEISPEESLRRGVDRDPGEKEAIERGYRVRYVPGQQLYKDEAKPHEVSDIIVDYNDPRNPVIL